MSSGNEILTKQNIIKISINGHHRVAEDLG